jgi:hypothetical protein
MTGRRRRRRKRLLDDLEKTSGYCKLKEEVLDRTGFVRGYGPVVRSATAGLNE